MWVGTYLAFISCIYDGTYLGRTYLALITSNLYWDIFGSGHNWGQGHKWVQDIFGPGTYLGQGHIWPIWDINGRDMFGLEKISGHKWPGHSWG